MLNAGDLFFNSNPLANHLREALTRKAEFIADAFRSMGYQAIAVGDYDLAAGGDFLHRQAVRTGLPLLSANLRERRTRSRPFAPFVRLEVDGLRVGVLGLITDGVKLDKNWEVSNPIRVAKQVVAEMSSECDLIIVLSHLGLPMDQKLAQAVPGIDIIVGGHTSSMLLQPLMVGNTLIVQASNRGQYVGRLELTIQDDGKLSCIESHTNALVPLTSDFEDDPAIRKLVEDYKVYLNQLGAAGTSPKSARGTPQLTSIYTGETQCASCHPAQHRFWTQTVHAHAYPTLVEREQQFNPECIGCHTTGYRTTGGYWRPNMVLTSRDLTNVQCENCHGPASNHVRGPTRSNIARIPSEKTCRGCHTPANDPNFDFTTDLLRISCPSASDLLSN